MPFLTLATGKRIHYRDVSPSTPTTRPPIILVHGLGSSQNYYLPVVPTLVAHGYRCISLDTTGSGRSPYTYVEQSVSSLAQDIADALDALSISSALVAGHSMAGLTVPHLAAAFPERVAGIILLGPVTPNPGAKDVFEGRIAAVEQRGMEAMGDTVPYAAVGSRAGALQHAFIREVLMAQDPRGYISLCRVIVGAGREGIEYGAVKCPAVIIAGEEDKSAPLEGCKSILEQLGGEKELQVMQGIGHWMCVEDGEDVGRRIVEWAGRAIQ